MYNHHLDIFIKVADAGSFSKAAEAIYISPNAVMKQVNRLEEHLGFSLFARSKHGLSLTEAGQLIYHDAKLLIKHSEKTLRQARAIVARKSRLIRVGSSLMRPGQQIVTLLKEIQPVCPDLRMQIVSFDDERERYFELIEHLGERIDVICGLIPSTKFGCRVNALTLEWQPLICAMPMSHPLAARDKLTAKDLYGEKLIMVHRGNTFYIDSLRNEIEKEHPQIELMDVPHYDITTMNLCEKTNCLMITARIWETVHPSLVTRPVEWNKPHAVPYGLMYALNPSEAVREFVTAIRQVKGLGASGEAQSL